MNITLAQRPVLDSVMGYREASRHDAPAVLFLHGNPTSSFIWRDIIPHVATVAHCTAPDLIGFGQSGKPDIEYRFRDHVRYLDAFIAASGITSAYLVAQDWARRSPSIWRRDAPGSCAGLRSWNSFARCRRGRTSIRLRPCGICSAGSGPRARANS